LNGFSSLSSSNVAIFSKTLAISSFVITKTVNLNYAAVDDAGAGPTVQMSHPATSLIKSVAIDD
jgi:hypothetical protein